MVSYVHIWNVDVAKICDHRLSHYTHEDWKRILAFIEAEEVIGKTLKHLGLWDFKVGLRQHGLPDLKLADLVHVLPLIEITQRWARKISEADPGLK